MRNLPRAIAAAAAILSLAGCLSTHVARYNAIDLRERTISVPADDSLLVGTIKQRLQRLGWTIIVPDPTQPAGPPARYALAITQERVVDFCGSDAAKDPVVSFHIILMDNKTKDAILTENGRDCTRTAATTFITAVRAASQR